MNVVQFGQGSCERIRRYLDSYIAGELLVETNHEILRHLETCAGCSAELEALLRLRDRVRAAARAETAPPHLAETVRRRIREDRAQPWLVRGLIAAALILAIAGGPFAVRYWQQYRKAVALFEAASGRLARVFRPGLANHVECAVFRNYSSQPPKIEDLEDDLPSEYAGLARLVRDRLPKDYRIVLAHRCRHGGRPFVHMVVRSQGGLASLAISARRPGDSFSAEKPLPDASAIPLFHAVAREFDIVAFESPRHIAFLVSDLPREANLKIARAVVPAVRAFLASMQG